MGSMRDTLSELKVVNFLVPQTIIDTTDVVVTDIDLQDYNSALIAISAAVSGDAAPGFKIKVEHGDDGVAYAACTVADLLGVSAITTDGIITDTDKVFDDGTAGHDIGSADGTAHTAVFGYKGGKRYLQITIDEDGTNANGTTFSGVIIKGHPRLAPVDQL